MEIYKIDSSNVATAVSALKEGGKHFIITVEVSLPKGICILGENSIYTFQGGSFVTNSATILFLEACQIYAAAYPIFGNNIIIEGECLINSEVKAEWFRLSENGSDADSINKALVLSNGYPVVLESRTYTLKDSIRFNPSKNVRQRLICPGTLLITPEDTDTDMPAIDINTREVSLEINKIEGVESSISSSGSERRSYNGTGIRFGVYTENSDIQVKTMSKLHKGFCVQPDTWDTDSQTTKSEYGGIQNCSIKFGHISADYCFYIDVFSKADYVNKETGQIVNLKNTQNLSQLKLTPTNWFNTSQIAGDLIEGQYGIYVVGPDEFNVETRNVSDVRVNSIDPEKVSNVLTGLKFDNISFENLSYVPVRLRSVSRSRFLNIKIHDDVATGSIDAETNSTPWIDMANVNELRMSFNSPLIPTRIKVDGNCRNTFLNGVILTSDTADAFTFDTLGVDTLYRGRDSLNQPVYQSQMFVTDSIMPSNTARNINTADIPGSVITKYIKDLLPVINENSSDPKQFSLSVLPTTLNIDIQSGKTFNLYLSGLNTFPPCLFNVNVTIAEDGVLNFRTSDDLLIEADTPVLSSSNVKKCTLSGTYTIRWLTNNLIRISKIK